MPRYMVTVHLFVDAAELDEARSEAARALQARGGAPADDDPLNVPSYIIGKAYEGFEIDDAAYEGFEPEDAEGAIYD